MKSVKINIFMGVKLKLRKSNFTKIIQNLFLKQTEISESVDFKIITITNYELRIKLRITSYELRIFLFINKLIFLLLISGFFI